MTAHLTAKKQAIQTALKQAYLFSRADPEEIQSLAEEAEWISLADTLPVLKEGEHCRSLFILAKGKLVVKEAVTQHMELIIARITPGDVVGELGFIDKKAASATVRSDGPADLVRLDYLSLKELFTRNIHLEMIFYREVTKILADRLRHGNQALRRSLLTSNSLVGRS